MTPVEKPDCKEEEDIEKYADNGEVEGPLLNVSCAGAVEDT